MTNLFWRKSSGETKNVIESPFLTEEELEKYLEKTKELLSDLFIIKRQVHASHNKDIPDLIALDKEGSVVIIELKNVLVSEDIISQVLRYALWAETNPDSIKALWLEHENKPDDINISWNNLSVKILVIAPSVSPRVLRLTNKINYPVSFLEIKKFKIEKDEFILTNQFEPELESKPSVTKGMEVYDMDFYLKNRNKTSVPKFFETIEIVDKIVNEKHWNLEKKMNKFYVSYKYGYPIVFGVNWIGSKSFGLVFKLPKAKVNAIKIPGIEALRYEDEWKQVIYKIEEPNVEVKKLMPLFDASFQYITGIK